MSDTKRLIAGFRPCGHAEQVGGADDIHDAELRKWLHEGLTLREISLADWLETHAAFFLCECPQPPGKWDAALLDALMLDMETDVRLGICELPKVHEASRQYGLELAEARARIDHEKADDIFRVVGFWMYRLLNCKPGGQLAGEEAIRKFREARKS